MPAIIQKDEDFEDSRRDFLVKALSAGLFTGGLGWNMGAMAQLFGSVPRRLPEGQSIFKIVGHVLVNGQPATAQTKVLSTDKIETGDGSYVIAAVGDSAFILRERSALELGGKQLLVRSMRLVTGKLLSVFGHRSDDEQAQMRTGVATIGIRGTGVYMESDPEKTYFCTCYGLTEIASDVDPNDRTQVASRHHDAPKYILKDADAGQRIVPAPFLNHTDIELMTIEAIVGRKVPFGITGSEYDGPQREY